MKHTYKLEGYCYLLRPIKRSDAATIVDIRRGDSERNRYIHSIPLDVAVQEQWLDEYFQRNGDYYFAVENRITGEVEGLISFYDAVDGKAEWGRWVLRNGSLAAAESVWLLYRIAFEQVGLRELYCRTIVDNTAVVSFHTSIGEQTRAVHVGLFELDGTVYDAVEQYSGRENFYEKIAPVLEKQSKKVLHRYMKQRLNDMRFHHIGVVAHRIEQELPIYLLLGYEKQSDIFEDGIQGVRGVFLASEGHPQLELLENLPDSHTLDIPLKQNQKLYHIAYSVKNIEQVVDLFIRNRAKVISPLKKSTYFGKRICFLMLPNMLLLELVED